MFFAFAKYQFLNGRRTGKLTVTCLHLFFCQFCHLGCSARLLTDFHIFKLAHNVSVVETAGEFKTSDVITR